MVLVASALLRRPFDDRIAVLGPLFVSLFLSLGSLMATWMLIAALVEHRPVWDEPRTRFIWLWAVVSCTTLAVAGWLGKDSNTFGAGMLYASGMLALVLGLIGLPFALLPRRGTRSHS